MSDNFPFDHFLNVNNSSHLNDIQKNIEKNNLQHNLLNNNRSSYQEVNNKAPIENYEDDFNLEEMQSFTDEILNSIQNFVNPQKFSAYFKNTFTVSTITEELITFSVTTNFIKKMVENHNMEHLNAAIKEALGKEYKFMIEVINTTQSPSSNTNNLLNSINKSKNTSFTEEISQNAYQVKKATTVKDMKFSINDLYPSKEDLVTSIESKVINHLNDKNYGQIIDSRKTFKSFIVGPNNSFAHASSVAVSKNPGKVYPSMYIHGNSGLGKTHLLHAVANHISETQPTLRIYMTTAKDFMTEMVDAIQSQCIANFRKKYSEQIDVLMVDDIQELKNKTSTQNEFFHVFNELHNKGKQLIFTSDKHPKDIGGIEERIKTRLSWGIVVDIQLPDLETRTAILKRKAAEEDIYLPDDVVALIARSIKSNIRELEGSLIKLGAFSSVFNVDIDLDVAREQLKLNENSSENELSMESIAKAVSNYLSIPIADLKSKARNKEVTHARHIGMYLSNKLFKATLVSIGQYYGGRDHSSVLHAIDKITKQVKENTPIVNQIFEIESTL
jgi:chromosomal replication initiator protein